MSAGKVDVLAVLDEAANHADGGSAPISGDPIREARAAVAELIEASNNLANAKALDLDAAETWWRAALARVQP